MHILIHEQQNLRIWNSQLSHLHSTASAGTIIAIDQQGVHVVCGDQQVICFTQLQWPGGKTLNASQVGQTQKINVGQTFA